MLGVALAAQEVTVSVSPRPVVAGQQANLTLSVSGSASPTASNLPAVRGITWYQAYSSAGSVINNGALTRADGTALTQSDLYFAEVTFPGNRTEWYVGENVPITIKYYIHEYAKVANVSYPTIRENPAFAIRKYTDRMGSSIDVSGNVVEGPIELRHKEHYNTYVFQGVLRPLRAGVVADGMVDGVVHQPVSSSRRDDIFSLAFGGQQMRQIQLAAKLPPMKVLSLPNAPEGVINLGLIGNYKPTFNISDAPYKTGEPVTLDLLIPNASSEGLRSDPATAEGFRMFPPEVSQIANNSGVRLRYVMIPLRAGELPLKLAFAYFNPLTGKYVTVPFEKTLKVEDNPYAARTTYTPPSTGGNVEDPDHQLSDLHYLKTPDPRNAVTLPLWRNKLLPAAGFLLICFFVWISAEIILLRRRLSDNAPEAVRRRNALKRKGILLSKIRKADDAAFENGLAREIVEWIADMEGLPPGATPSEVAGRCPSTEVVAFLRAVESAGYCPGGTCGLSRFRDTLAKAVKRGTFLVIFGISAFALQDVHAQTVDTGITVVSDTVAAADLRTLYDRGEFIEALKGNLRLLRAEKAVDPALLYNIGNIYYQAQYYPEALLCFERARRLAPDDSDILNNLNAACRKLELPERGGVTNPVELLAAFRDSFRIDTWFLMILAGAGLLFVALAVLRLGRRRIGLWVLGAAGVIFVFSLAMFIWQDETLYRTDEALVLRERTPVWMLPQADGAKQRAALNAGITVTIREQRPGWTLIRYHGGEGWVRSHSVAPIWTGDRDDLIPSTRIQIK